MSTRMKIAFGCYFLAGLILVGFGVTYLLRSEFMPYHATAIAMPWSDVPPYFQTLILALMKALGGTYVALALALYLILLVPFRQGAVWALWTTPLIGIIQSAATLYAMSHVALNTPATPPFIAPIAGALLSVVAFVLSISDPKKHPMGRS
jgi:hypothetical protein